MPPLPNLEWQKLMRQIAKIAGKLQHGEIVIKIQEGKPVITDYTVKRKITDPEADDFIVKDLDD